MLLTVKAFLSDDLFLYILTFVVNGKHFRSLILLEVEHIF